MRTLSRAEISEIASLKRPHGRDVTGLFAVEGRKSVAEFLAAGWVAQQLLAVPVLGDAFPEAELIDVPSMEAISAMASAPGVLAVFRQSHADPSGIRLDGRLLVLDGIADPGNFGTVIRTAEWFGITAIALCGDAAEPWNPKAVQASMGSLARVPVYRFAKPGTLIHQCAEAGVPILVSDAAMGRTLQPSDARAVLVIGSESHGVSQAFRAAAAEFVHIAGPGRAESLNAAVAAGILMSQWHA